jgi:glutathione S-transferase
MKLVGSRTSPYVRKVRVMLAEKGIACEFLEESAWTATTTVPRYNPLNKVPALVLDDGESIYDSAVITGYLDGLPGRRYLPADGVPRAKARRDEALGDGIMDAGVTLHLERKRDAARQDPAWIQRQADKVNSGIAALEGLLGSRPFLGGDEPSVGDFACGAGLLWLEFRLAKDFPWRERYPSLKAWIARLEDRPSFVASRPPPA